MTLSFEIFTSEAPEVLPEILPEILSEMHAMSFPHGSGQVWSAADIRSILHSPGTEALVVSLNQTPAGFLLWRRVVPEAEILSVAIIPVHRGKGAGHQLIRQLFDRAAQAGVREIFLEVNAQNKAALGLYKKTGFMLAGRRRGYYDTDSGSTQDALIMKYNLK